MSQLKVNSIIPVGGIPTSGGNVYGGGIIQIVQNETETQAVINSTSFADIGLSATITPTSSSSKILVVYDIQVRIFIATTDNSAAILIMRDSTPIFAQSQDYQLGYNARAVYNSTSGTSYLVSRAVLDSPNTTSPITYKIQGKMRNTGSGNQVDFQDDGAYYSFLTLLEVSA